MLKRSFLIMVCFLLGSTMACEFYIPSRIKDNVPRADLKQFQHFQVPVKQPKILTNNEIKQLQQATPAPCTIEQIIRDNQTTTVIFTHNETRHTIQYFNQDMHAGTRKTNKKAIVRKWYNLVVFKPKKKSKTNYTNKFSDKLPQNEKEKIRKAMSIATLLN